MAITIDKITSGCSSIAITDGGGSITVDGTVTINANYDYPEDSTHVDADPGAFVLAVRQDTKASTAGTDGDYAAFIQDADGDLYVTDTVAQGYLSTLAGAVSGTEFQVDIVSAPGIYIEDDASTGGESLYLVGGYRQDVLASPVSADGDYQGFLFNSLGELYVTSANDDIANSSLVVTAVTVDTTVGGINLIGTELANRREITLQNLGSESIFVKAGTGVTIANGFEIPACSSATYSWGDAIDLYAITASGTSDIRVVEAA